MKRFVLIILALLSFVSCVTIEVPSDDDRLVMTVMIHSSYADNLPQINGWGGWYGDTEGPTDVRVDGELYSKHVFYVNEKGSFCIRFKYWDNDFSPIPVKMECVTKDGHKHKWDGVLYRPSYNQNVYCVTQDGAFDSFKAFTSDFKSFKIVLTKKI